MAAGVGSGFETSKTSSTKGPSQESDFAARHFLETRYREDCDRFPVGVARAKCYNLLYKKYCPGVVDPNASKSLDIGCGPTLTGAIGLAPYVSSIVLSEYEHTNLNELKLWKEKSPKAFNWLPFMLATLTGSEDDKHNIDDGYIRAQEEEIRGKISDIIPCDVRTKEIIDPRYVPKGGFDVVTCMGALEAAASTMSEFYWMFENVSSVLKPGGLFVVYVSLRGTFYSLGEPPKRYPELYVTESDVQDALGRAGFNTQEWNITSNKKSPSTDVTGYYIGASFKQ
jgi:SAM-dependent methyltransferase